MDPGVFLVVPDTGEKGYLDVRVEVSTKGGHSSVPPKHTVRFLYLIPIYAWISFVLI